MKKGFTLIKLLAVIVVIAIIAVIAVPIILQIIETAKIGALEDTVYGLSEAGEIYYAKSILDNEEETALTFTPNIENTGLFSVTIQLPYKGTIPSEGSYVSISTKGDVEVKVKSDTYCGIKYATSIKVVMYKNDCLTLLSGNTDDTIASSSELNALKALIGPETLSTTAQTVTGAINELNSNSGNSNDLEKLDLVSYIGSAVVLETVWRILFLLMENK